MTIYKLEKGKTPKFMKELETVDSDQFLEDEKDNLKPQNDLIPPAYNLEKPNNLTSEDLNKILEKIDKNHKEIMEHNQKTTENLQNIMETLIEFDKRILKVEENQKVEYDTMKTSLSNLSAFKFTIQETLTNLLKRKEERKEISKDVKELVSPKSEQKKILKPKVFIHYLFYNGDLKNTKQLQDHLSYYYDIQTTDSENIHHLFILLFDTRYEIKVINEIEKVKSSKKIILAIQCQGVPQKIDKIDDCLLIAPKLTDTKKYFEVDMKCESFRELYQALYSK